MSTTIVLPYPPSANRYWRSYVPKGWGRSVVAVSDEAKAYKEQAAWLIRQAGITAPMRGLVTLDATLHPRCPQDAAKRAQRDPNGWEATVSCLDVDNALKVTLDALKGHAIEDDANVFDLRIRRGTPHADGRLVVVITPFVRDEPQPLLFTKAARCPA